MRALSGLTKRQAEAFYESVLEIHQKLGAATIFACFGDRCSRRANAWYYTNGDVFDYKSYKPFCKPCATKTMKHVGSKNFSLEKIRDVQIRYATANLTREALKKELGISSPSLKQLLG